MDPFKPFVDRMLRVDLDAPSKQRHTVVRILARLVEEHQAVDISYAMVRDYVRQRRAEIRLEEGRGPPVGFIEQTHRPGVEAEVDFGDVWIRLNGQLTRCYLFAFRLSWSGKAVHQAFLTCSQEAFFEGHVHALTALGGCPTGKVRYDNLKAAVAKVLGFSRARVETERWIAFRCHWGIDAWYCRPGMEGAHEKGGGGRADRRVVSFSRKGTLPRVGPEAIDDEGDFVTVVRTRRPTLRVFPPGRPPRGSATRGGELWVVAMKGNSLAMVPVVVDGAVAAVVTVGRIGNREPLGTADVDLLGRMLAHAYVHLSKAMRFQRTQRVALALQNYLLPDPPQVAGLEIAARYRASATSVEIGGDWYDCFVRPDGSTMLTIGDVAGHDLTAAVIMSQLRNMLRGLAMDREEHPGEILRRLNIATELLYPDDMATCILARLRAAHEGDWRLTYSVAGHLPPLIVTRQGQTRYLEAAPNPLLGIGSDRPRISAVTTLPPHSTLLLYTDGLIEVPGEHLDTGLERLRRSGACLARAPLDDFCDGLLTARSATYKDDIAMIAVRLPGTSIILGR